MAKAELDGFVVGHPPNVRYLTGFSGSAGVLLLTQNGAVFSTDFRYREQVEEEVDGALQVEIVRGDVMSSVFSQGENRGCRRLGYEAHIVSAGDAHSWAEQNGRKELVGEQGWIEDLRTVKEAEEVEAIRCAAQLATGALTATIERFSIGMREIDVAADLESELRRRGSEWHPFETIVASGPRAALPHARTTDRRIQRGDWLLIDFGARVDGYCSDITRTFVVGAPADERQRAMYELTYAAQQSALRGIKAGLTGRQGDALARSVIEARGFGDAFGHSLGHGLGLDVHEEPRVSKLNEDTLPVGAVVTIEPGVYFPGWGGVRLEDDVHLTASGAELLSDGQTELQVIP